MIAHGLVVAVLLSTGCAYRATVTTSPAGAAVYLDNEPAGITPLPIEVRGVFQRQVLRVELPGYRPYEVVLAKESRPWPKTAFALTHPLVLLGKRPPPTRTLVLIPEHGPAGTWTPEDVER